MIGRGILRGLRARRIGLVPVLLAYALLLVGSPVTQTALLWVHLATAHEGLLPKFETPDHDEHGPEAAHDEGDHDHTGPQSGHEEIAETDGPMAASTPHEHDGRVHTHEQAPREDSAVSISAVEKEYLNPSHVLLTMPGSRVVATELVNTPMPRAIPLTIETPPPRLPA